MRYDFAERSAFFCPVVSFEVTAGTVSISFSDSAEEAAVSADVVSGILIVSVSGVSVLSCSITSSFDEESVFFPPPAAPIIPIISHTPAIINETLDNVCFLYHLFYINQ